MTQAKPTNYWISPSALFIQLNAAGDRNYIHANCASGSMVMCYMKGIDGLEYDNAHNYRRWALIASPTVFHDNNRRYVYIAIPKSTDADAVAQVVFSPVELDLYGKSGEEGSETQVGPTDYYYIFTQGIISASEDEGVVKNRSWEQQFNYGSLASDEAIASGGEGQWWEYNTTTDMVKFLKTISEAIFEKLTATWASITTLVLNGKPLKFVAGEDTDEESEEAVVTPSYAGKRYLSRTHDDTAQGNITILKSVTVGNYEKDIQVGIGSKEGVRMLPDGTIIARNLELSQSLSVPTLKYNQIEVLAGTRWDSAGKGRVKEIISTDDALHTCQFVLDLNNGEPGEFIIGDILRGFWNNMDGTLNATENSDDRHGNITRAGFMSIYCRVVAVADVVERVVDDTTYYIAKDANYVAEEGDTLLQAGLVTVVMRQFDAELDTWSPAPVQWSVLSVSGTFATDHPERQNFFVYTTTYMARFQGVNTWEWQDHNFMGGWGDLTGFTMLQYDDNEQLIYRKEFNGEGFVTKDAYIYGILDQFTRFSDKIEVALSNPDGTVGNGERLRADFVLKDISGNVISDGYQLSITRQTGDDEADAIWNAAMAEQYPDGVPSALYFEYADVPENGAVFVVAAKRQVTTSDGTQIYSTSTSFLLTRAVMKEDFKGEWDADTAYTKTSRIYPTVTYGGCKWYLVADTSTGEEPYPGSSVWRMLYGVTDMAIRFYDANGMRILSSVQIPGEVDLYLDPRLFCGNFDITSELTDSDWTWERYTGNYGEETDTRSEAEKQSDQGWRYAHWPEQPMTRTIRILNEDMPPTWGSGPVVNFIITANYDGLEIPNIVSF